MGNGSAVGGRSHTQWHPYQKQQRESSSREEKENKTCVTSPSCLPGGRPPVGRTVSTGLVGRKGRVPVVPVGSRYPRQRPLGNPKDTQGGKGEGSRDSGRLDTSSSGLSSVVRPDHHDFLPSLVKQGGGTTNTKTKVGPCSTFVRGRVEWAGCNG